MTVKTKNKQTTFVSVKVAKTSHASTASFYFARRTLAQIGSIQFLVLPGLLVQGIQIHGHVNGLSPVKANFRWPMQIRDTLSTHELVDLPHNGSIILPRQLGFPIGLKVRVAMHVALGLGLEILTQRIENG